nr:ORF2 [Torque teno felis virus]
MQNAESDSLSTRSSAWSEEDDRRKRHEAIWKQTCSRTHSLWCSCGNWTSHIKPWPTTDDPGTEDADGDGKNLGTAADVASNADPR